MSGEQFETRPRMVFHPGIRELHPGFFNALEAELGDQVKIAIVTPDLYSDRTPKLLIPDIPSGTPTVLIPGFISGRHAEDTLLAITKTTHALRYPHAQDKRSPWTLQAHLLLTDLEGRGNKPTQTSDGALLDEAELHYAYYLTDMLNACRADSATVLDPHDAESVKALQMPVTAITALGECHKYMRANGLIPQNSGVVIADDGAIGRAHFFAHIAELPVSTRIVKKRINGKPTVIDVYGKDNISDKTAILVDDMIATGGTLFKDAEELMQLGAKDVCALITHIKGVGGVREQIVTRLKEENNGLTSIIMTNSTPYHQELDHIPGVYIINVYPLLARAAKAVLEPTEENVAALIPDLFPIASSQENLEQLYTEYPDLAPDFTPLRADDAPTSNPSILFQAL